ncbi:hypothetical protein SAMN04489812_2587 [Microlunatus soli]|uniref:Uncharacterized protein n=2 Tax=Microlunatus soli TaxID=630515 RepID=A0A1H1U0E5_9ACTN|nr:hypothetical protein SAMN04489812_2587 [Microlunatus soli]
MMLQAAQSQFVKYYKAYLVEGMHPTHAPSKRLLAMTHPDGAERTILKESFANAREEGSRIESAEISISVGPEGKSNGSKRTELKFKACIDGRRAKVGDGTKSRSLPWELLNVDMRAKAGASPDARATEPSSWLVYSANQLDKGSPCEL